jgi:hypothetical protein
MICIHSGNVVGDNLWLWRADHVKLCPDEKPNVEGLDYHQTTSGEFLLRPVFMLEMMTL